MGTDSLTVPEARRPSSRRDRAVPPPEAAAEGPYVGSVALFLVCVTDEERLSV